MHASLQESLYLSDASNPDLPPGQKYVRPGRYELTQIPNPYGHAEPWLVIRGTMTGMSKSAWEQHRRPGTHPIVLDDQEMNAADNTLVEALRACGIPEVIIHSRAMPQMRDRGFCEVLVPEINAPALETTLAITPGYTTGRLVKIRITTNLPAQVPLPVQELVLAPKPPDDNGSHPGVRSLFFWPAGKRG